MAQLTDDCFAFGGELMPTAEALDLLAQRTATVVSTERVELRQASGRILAEDIQASGDVPPHNNSAVDGFAVSFDDLDPNAETRLKVIGRATAGHPFTGNVGAGEAIRIFTGAEMMSGPDTVIMQEDCSPDGENVVIRPGIKRGANVRSAGEDIKAGSIILEKNRRLRPQDVGLAASVGRASLTVYKPLRVAVFSTGDELYDPDRRLPAGGIHDSNRYTLLALLEALGCTANDLGILEDRFGTIRDALDQAAQDHDLIVTSGGMSVGDEDHVKAAVEALGSLHFWRLAIKPGRPIGLGQVGTVPFIGLPGNPVAVMVTFMRIARPMILRLGGCTDVAPNVFQVRADFAHKKKTGRREWVRARLVADGNGQPVATKFPRQGAGILSSMVEADGLVELPEDMKQLEAGTTVDFLPFSELSR